MTMCNSNPLGKPEAEHTIIAFDVAKETLAIHVLPDDSAHAIANRPAAVRAFLRRAAVKARTPVLVVCEATGGYERHVVDAAHALGLALHRAHGQRTRLFALYRGLAAKTDPLDARMLALYGRDTPDLRLHAPDDPDQTTLRALRKRRDDLAMMIGMEQRRLHHAGYKRIERSITRHITAMRKELAELDAEIETLIETSPQLARKAALIRSIKGVGPMTAQACLAYMPELGTLTKGQAASLAGLAPVARDSGKLSAPRRISAGRKTLRSCLYMAAVVAASHNPVFKQYAAEMRQRGKPAKVIITAIMRRLVVIINAILKEGKPCRQSIPA
ncbi:IS110 family transposase [Oricola thermophila]|uniref:IS110 family transposase n=1 Tax=Oricola thermophila TaxID=2742145 RepID=A0A6N1VFY2_9HYPH|nr:IS110 family transposase [Oricola thermophila]QKV17129.1 IS110 family transposase [Oricola thermophila]QKV19698.1 IS110 family transposase [Oricola thermophila]